MLSSYDIVAVTSGAGDITNKLGMPGENLPHVLDSLQITGWYNSHPFYTENGRFEIFQRPNLSKIKNVVIIGLGNVALDVARIFSMSTENLNLSYSDIDPEVFEQLKNSAVENVYICGRRGPLAFKGTRKELKELKERTSDLTNVSVLDDHLITDVEHNEILRLRGEEQMEEQNLDQNPHKESIFMSNFELEKFKRAAKVDLSKRNLFRTYAYLRDFPVCEKSEPHKILNPDWEPKNSYEDHDEDETYEKYLPDKQRHCQFRFFRTPTKITEKEIEFLVTADEKNVHTETLPADLVVICTGNKNSGWENTVKYGRGGVVEFNHQEVEGDETGSKISNLEKTFRHDQYENLYFAGWARTGSKGVVNDSLMEAQIVSDLILKKLERIDPTERTLGDDFIQFIDEMLADENKFITLWDDWQKIRKYERDFGHENGKYRIKVRNVEDFEKKLEMLKAEFEKQQGN